MPADAIPVELGYYLTFPDQQGRLRQYGDIYGLQDRAVQVPSAADPVPEQCGILPG
jgi:murein L,D-transpeptidase YcbB/YkuD